MEFSKSVFSLNLNESLIPLHIDKFTHNAALSRLAVIKTAVLQHLRAEVDKAQWKTVWKKILYFDQLHFC